MSTSNSSPTLNIDKSHFVVAGFGALGFVLASVVGLNPCALTPTVQSVSGAGLVGLFSALGDYVAKTLHA